MRCRRQRDLGKKWKRHGQDRGICMDTEAIATAGDDPAARGVDRSDDGAKLDRHTLTPTVGREEGDEGTITLGNATLLSQSTAHPSVAQREGAGAARISRVEALDHSDDGPPQLVISRLGEMLREELGNRQI